MVTYGGDEVSALVLDVGSSSTRAGYAGEDTPKAVFSTTYGVSGNASSQKYHIGDTETSVWKSDMEMRNPMDAEGLVTDWDILEKIWAYALKTRLQVDPVEHPLLVTEPAWNTSANKEKMAELAFEKFNVPALYAAKSPVMSAFASGKPTALILDVGGSTTSVVPVYEGLVLKKPIIRQDLGGDYISEQLRLHLQASGVDLTPHYLISNKQAVEAGQPANFTKRERPATKSYDHFQRMKVVNDFKESMAQALEQKYDEGVVSARPFRSFEFPSGYNAAFGAELYSAPEIFFQPAAYSRPLDLAEVGSLLHPPTDLNACISVPQMLYNSVVLCDMDVRAAMLSNIVITGGGSLLSGFTDRVNTEMHRLAPGNKIRIQAPGNAVERKCSAWLGGSILSSLGTFHQLWVSRKEYDEHGPSILEKRCK